jgi:hypothetical protein
MRGCGKMPADDAAEVESNLSGMLRLVKDLQELAEQE